LATADEHHVVAACVDVLMASTVQFAVPIGTALRQEEVGEPLQADVDVLHVVVCAVADQLAFGRSPQPAQLRDPSKALGEEPCRRRSPSHCTTPASA